MKDPFPPSSLDHGNNPAAPGAPNTAISPSTLSSMISPAKNEPAAICRSVVVISDSRIEQVDSHYANTDMIGGVSSERHGGRGDEGISRHRAFRISEEYQQALSPRTSCFEPDVPCGDCPSNRNGFVNNNDIAITISSETTAAMIASATGSRPAVRGRSPSDVLPHQGRAAVKSCPTSSHEEPSRKRQKKNDVRGCPGACYMAAVNDDAFVATAQDGNLWVQGSDLPKQDVVKDIAGITDADQSKQKDTSRGLKNKSSPNSIDQSQQLSDQSHRLSDQQSSSGEYTNKEDQSTAGPSHLMVVLNTSPFNATPEVKDVTTTHPDLLNAEDENLASNIHDGPESPPPMNSIQCPRSNFISLSDADLYLRYYPRLPPTSSSQCTGVPVSSFCPSLSEGEIEDLVKNYDGLSEHPRLCLDDYVKVMQIGQGAYGDVWLAEDWRRDRLVALKKLKLNEEREGFPKNIIREISLLRSLDHPNIVRFYGVACSRRKQLNFYLSSRIRLFTARSDTAKANSPLCNSSGRGVTVDDALPVERWNATSKGSIWMVFEYLPFDLNGTIDQLREQGEQLSVAEIRVVLRGILQALQFCHSKNVIHRDLKSANLLITPEGHVKLADFGLARSFDCDTSPLTNRVVTLWYRPPELLLGTEAYCPSVDIWSTGCIFAELVTSKALFWSDKEASVLKAIAECLGPPTDADWPERKSLPLWDNVEANPLLNSLVGVGAGSGGTSVHDLLSSRAGGSNVNKVDALWTRLHERIGSLGVELLKSMLRYNPKERITAMEALNHQWFAVDRDISQGIRLCRFNRSHCHAYALRRDREKLRDLQRRRGAQATPAALPRRQGPRMLCNTDFLEKFRRATAQQNAASTGSDVGPASGAVAASPCVRSVIVPAKVNVPTCQTTSHEPHKQSSKLQPHVPDHNGILAPTGVLGSIPSPPRTHRKDLKGPPLTINPPNFSMFEPVNLSNGVPHAHASHVSRRNMPPKVMQHTTGHVTWGNDTIHHQLGVSHHTAQNPSSTPRRTSSGSYSDFVPPPPLKIPVSSGAPPRGGLDGRRNDIQPTFSASVADDTSMDIEEDFRPVPSGGVAVMPPFPPPQPPSPPPPPPSEPSCIKQFALTPETAGRTGVGTSGSRSAMEEARPYVSTRDQQRATGPSGPVRPKRRVTYAESRSRSEGEVTDTASPNNSGESTPLRQPSATYISDRGLHPPSSAPRPSSPGHKTLPHCGASQQSITPQPAYYGHRIPSTHPSNSPLHYQRESRSSSGSKSRVIPPDYRESPSSRHHRQYARAYGHQRDHHPEQAQTRGTSAQVQYTDNIRRESSFSRRRDGDRRRGARGDDRYC